MTQVYIIGAGLAGLLAGNMLRHRSKILEKQPSLPNNHSALLRFRSGIVGTTTNIPFKKVKMMKAVFGGTNPIADTLKYSRKVLGTYRTDRSLPVGVVQEERFIAPHDLINQMAEGLEIEFGLDAIHFLDKHEEPIISTMPMPLLIKSLGYNKQIEFNYKSSWVITAEFVGVDAYATLYYPDEQFQAYRASITGNKFILELPADSKYEVKRDIGFATSMVVYYMKTFGLTPLDIDICNIEMKEQQYGKIVPIDEDTRKEFMHWATDQYNIYSLGRFATWRPGLLLDDLVHDVSMISQWIMRGGKYGLKKHRGG